MKYEYLVSWNEYTYGNRFSCRRSQVYSSSSALHWALKRYNEQVWLNHDPVIMRRPVMTWEEMPEVAEIDTEQDRE